MEAPEHIVEGLKGIRSTFELRWNPRAKRIRPGAIGVDGGVTPAEWDGRWELWDHPDSAPEHMVMTLRTPEDEFKPPGQWLIDLLNMTNPARWGGDPSKMIAYFLENPEQLRRDVHDNDADRFFEAVADEAAWFCQLRGTVPDQITA